MLSSEEIIELKQSALRVRRNILKMIHAAKKIQQNVRLLSQMET